MARCMYHSMGVSRNSRTALAAPSGSGTGSMKPLWVSTAMVRGPTGSRVVTGEMARPASLSTRAMLTVTSCAIRRGSLNGASMVAKVSPGTPATANSPDTRSGCRKASSNIVLTPMDQPMTGARSTPKWSITDSVSSTNASMPQWAGSVGRSEPPVPRWFQEMIRTPQSGRSSAGQVHGPVPSPLQRTTVGPSMAPFGSLVQAVRRVPSSDSTSW